MEGDKPASMQQLDGVFEVMPAEDAEWLRDTMAQLLSASVDLLKTFRGLMDCGDVTITTKTEDASEFLVAALTRLEDAVKAAANYELRRRAREATGLEYRGG
jgi:hypothetical protein